MRIRQLYFVEMLNGDYTEPMSFTDARVHQLAFGGVVKPCNYVEYERGDLKRALGCWLVIAAVAAIGVVIWMG